MKDYIDGILEYLTTDGRITLPRKNYFEMKDGDIITVSISPLIKIRAFEVRHPKPQMYIRLPFEPLPLPAVLGYEIAFREDGLEKVIILMGEGGTDPNFLWHVWNNRYNLAAVFVPVADEATTSGIKWIKDAYVHASLQVMALAVCRRG